AISPLTIHRPSARLGRAMIVSASYRTDIPAFYAEWFRNRRAAGFAMVRNPYGGKDYRVSLARQDVDAFVFWTRNAAPMLDDFARLHDEGTPFTVTMSILGYPKQLDARVIDTDTAIAQLRRIAAIHPRGGVWRYDPILVSDLTPPDWHRENFARLSGALAGVVDEVTISFATIYAKSRRNLARAFGGRESWRDPEAAEKRELLAELAAIARENGQRLTICSQPDLTGDGVEPARCIDSVRLADAGGRPFKAKTKGNRPGCLCAESRDIGAYDTCPHGCAYCYAVKRREKAIVFARDHDPATERLG
ncbi:MAG: DUF1848 domain-containing protein, partial [Rhodospirillales bacterium]